MVSIIVAYTEDMAIGYKNGLLYHISDDLKRFKRLTTGNVIVMGRKTFESLPKGALPDRENVVISTTISSLPGALVFRSLKEALDNYRQDRREIFIIGGGSIYAQAVDFADRICATEIMRSADAADTFFPHIDMMKWKVETESESQVDAKSGVTYRFVDYIRVK